MAESDKTKRYIAEKIALAALLVISLLVARLVVELRSVIRLTSPIELSRLGLSVSMPQGNGWRCDGKWGYGDNGYTVNSIFAVGAGAARSYARCHYILGSQQRTVQERFSEDAATIAGEVVETGRMDAGPSASPGGEQAGAQQLVVDWARISGNELEMVSGVCELAGGRQLEIDVLQTGDERGLAQNIFERIVKGIQYNDNGLLQAGIQLVNKVRETGLSTDLPGDDNQPVFSILSDSKGKAIGFTMDTIEVRTGEELPVRAASYFYRRGLAAGEEAGLFRGDSAIGQFDWRYVESAPRAGRKSIEMSAESGVLTVRKSDPGGREKEYALGEAAVPDIVLEPVLQKMLGSGPREIVIDVIRSAGVITPVYIEKVSGQDSNSINLEVLDGRGYRQQIYYDSDKRPTRILLKQEDTYTLNRATAEEIAKTFPERADLVLKQDQVLDREGI